MLNFDVKEELFDRGWVLLRTGIADPTFLRQELLEVSKEFGVPVPGRSRSLVEPVTPMPQEWAPARSLSARFGLEELPLHTDAAHWPIPCRYLLLACACAPRVTCETRFLPIREDALSAEEKGLLRQTPFRIRNSRNSFYGSVLGSDREFVRCDPGCMEAVTPNGEFVLGFFESERYRSQIGSHKWSVGDIVVIDNWRTLHGRAAAKDALYERTLLRTMVQ